MNKTKYTFFVFILHKNKETKRNKKKQKETKKKQKRNKKETKEYISICFFICVSPHLHLICIRQRRSIM